MDELQALQAQLQETFRAETAQKLSDRNVVELVSKLQALGLITLVYTLDGKEYLTPEKLEREVRDEVEARRRVAVMDLSPILNVDVVHIQRAADTIASSNSGVYLVSGELVADEYVDSLAEEINDELQEKGNADLVAFATAFNLPMEFVARGVSHRLGRTVHGTLDGYTLRTGLFVARQQARIRGAALGAGKPTALADLASVAGVPEAAVAETLQSMLASGAVRGELRGRVPVFTPASFAAARDTFLLQFFASNLYLEYETVAKYGLASGRKHAEELLAASGKGAGLVSLSTCVLAGSVIEQTDAAIEDALVSGAVLNARARLPGPLSRADAEAVLRLCPSLQTKEIKRSAEPAVVGDAIVVPPAVWRAVAAALGAAVDAAVASGAFGNAAGPAQEEDSEASTPTGGKKSGAKGKKKGGKATAGPAAEPVRLMLSEEAVLAAVLSAAPDLADEPDALAEVVAVMRPRTTAMIAASQAAAAAAAAAVATSTGVALPPLQERFADWHRRLALYVKAVAELGLLGEAGAALAAAVDAHVVKTLGTEILDAVVGDALRAAGGEGQAFASAAQRSKAIAQVGGGPAAAAMAALNEYAGSKAASTSELLVRIEDSAAALGLFAPRRPDRKAEKLLLAEQRALALAAMTGCTDPSVLTQLTVVVAFIQGPGLLVTIPGKSLGGAVALLDGQLLAPEHGAAVRALYEATHAWLRGRMQDSALAAAAVAVFSERVRGLLESGALGSRDKA